MVLELARPSEAWCFPPGVDFFEAVLLLAAAGNRICRKMLFFWDFRRYRREFFWSGFGTGDFFEAVLLLVAAGNRSEVILLLAAGGATATNTGPAAAGGLATAAGNRICRKMFFF